MTFRELRQWFATARGLRSGFGAPAFECDSGSRCRALAATRYLYGLHARMLEGFGVGQQYEAQDARFSRGFLHALAGAI